MITFYIETLLWWLEYERKSDERYVRRIEQIGPQPRNRSRMCSKLDNTPTKMLGAALATSNLVCCIASSKTSRQAQLEPSAVTDDIVVTQCADYIAIAICLMYLNYDNKTRFGLERDETTVVILRPLVPSGPCTVCNRVAEVTTRDSDAIYYMFRFAVACGFELFGTRFRLW